MQRNITREARRTVNVCLVHLDREEPTETFIRAHAARLPGRVAVVHGTADRPRFLDDVPPVGPSWPSRGWRLGRRVLPRAAAAARVAAGYAPAHRPALR